MDNYVDNSVTWQEKNMQSVCTKLKKDDRRRLMAILHRKGITAYALLRDYLMAYIAAAERNERDG